MAWLTTFLIAFGSSLLVTPIARYLGQRLGILDRPGELTVHHQPVPRTGGLAILASFLVAVAWAPWSACYSLADAGKASGLARGLFLGLMLVGAAVLLDDVHHISP